MISQNIALWAYVYQGFSLLPNIYSVLVGTDGKLSKTPNYENETEGLRQSLK
jgi:hypothetical protein